MFSLRATTAARRVPVAARSIASSARLQSSHVANNDPEVLEREKHRSLHQKHDDSTQPHKDHAPGWIEELASVSEANVKADQAKYSSPEELQKVTTEYIKKRHHADDSTIVGAADTVSSALHKAADKVSQVAHEAAAGSASYEKDQVEGPLASKGRK